MKICLIGCGGIAGTMHAPALKKYQQTHPVLQLAACCDTREEQALAMKEKFGFARHATDYRKMLQEERPDAVIVAVNTRYAANVGADVLRAGIPMLIEKPPGSNTQETRQLLAEAQKGQVPCQVAFNRRYMPVLCALREQTPDKLQLITYELIRHNRRNGHFVETAIHAIDTVRFLADADYRRVRFTYQEMPEYGQGVCNIFMDCQMTSGVYAQLRICHMTGATLERASLYGENRLVKAYTPVWGAYDHPGRIEDFRNDQPPIVTSFAPGEVFETNGFLAEDTAFLDAIAQKKSPRPNIAAALNSMQIKDCIDQRKTEFLLAD